MAMSDSSFDLILQELLHQQNFMENLEAENRELRQQIADLRVGKEIFVEILGHRFALLSEPTDIPSYTVPQAAVVSQTPTAPTAAVVSQTPTAPTAAVVSQVPTTVGAIEEYQPTIALAVLEQASAAKETNAEKQELAMPIPETPFPVMDFLVEDDKPITPASFLQEMQETDELVFENTNKLAVWGESAISPTPIPASAARSRRPGNSSLQHR